MKITVKSESNKRDAVKPGDMVFIADKDGLHPLMIVEISEEDNRGEYFLVDIRTGRQYNHARPSIEQLVGEMDFVASEDVELVIRNLPPQYARWAKE